MSNIINYKEQAIGDWNYKAEFNDPREGEFKFGFSQFSFDFIVFFNGKLFYFWGVLYHIVDSIALVEISRNINE